MMFNFLNPFAVTDMVAGFNPAAPNPLAGVTPLQQAPQLAAMPVANVDLLADQIGGAPDLSMYPAGGMSYAPTRPGMSFEAMTGQPERQMSYAAPGADVWGPSVADVAGAGSPPLSGLFKQLGGLMSSAPQQPRMAPPPPPPVGGGGGRAFDVTPFLRQPITRRGR